MQNITKKEIVQYVFVFRKNEPLTIDEILKYSNEFSKIFNLNIIFDKKYISNLVNKEQEMFWKKTENLITTYELSYSIFCSFFPYSEISTFNYKDECIKILLDRENETYFQRLYKLLKIGII